MSALALLNTSIITSDGTYSLETISLDQAIELVTTSKSIDSAIGHESTAQIMTTLLGVQVDLNRQMFSQELGQKALVFKLNGRPPEGSVLTLEELKAIGFSFKLMTRLS